MKFRTEYTAAFDPAFSFTHADPVWLVGSCFSDNVGERLQREGFDVAVNPLGTLYNPASIARALTDVATRRLYAPDEMVCNEGRWHSLMHHSRFSRSTAAEVADAVNTAVTTLHDALPSLHTLIITLGSAMAFRHIGRDEIVANCHKLHPATFELMELSIEQCVECLADAITALRRTAPQMRVILTVSPIRHKGYGMFRDRLSKSRLLIAADSLCQTLDGVRYFGAYEIMMDDLRDYRYYAADMIHPSEVAVDYIYGQFAATVHTPATRDAAGRALRDRLRMQHRDMR